MTTKKTTSKTTKKTTSKTTKKKGSKALITTRKHSDGRTMVFPRDDAFHAGDLPDNTRVVRYSVLKKHRDGLFSIDDIEYAGDIPEKVLVIKAGKAAKLFHSLKDHSSTAAKIATVAAVAEYIHHRTRSNKK
jgi:hypothetical protein